MIQAWNPGKPASNTSRRMAAEHVAEEPSGASCLPFRPLHELLAAHPSRPSFSRMSDEDRERYSAFTRHCFSSLEDEILNPELSETIRFERCIRHYVCCLLRKGVTIEHRQIPSGKVEKISVYALYYLILSTFLEHLGRPGPPVSPGEQVERNFARCTATLWAKRWRLSHRV